MGDKRNFAALDWVIGEITETLKDARQALEAYVEDPKDSTRIRFCLTHIHQVLGSLQMVEFHGASLLAEEMEQLAQALMDHKVTSAPEAQEVLMRSLLQLPIYLDHAKAQKEDNPGLVLPLLNDLRAVRNQSYLSETNLFSPNLQLLDEVFGSRHPITQDAAKLKQVLKKLREMYQFAAASVLRGIKVDDNLNYLDKVFSRMEALTIGTACFPLWEVSAALVEGLLRDDIELSVAVRGLLRHIARELRILGEKAPPSLDLRPRESLLKNLLYYIAKAESGGKKINRVKKRYKLSEAMLDGVIIGEDGSTDSLSAPDPEAIRSVVVALNDEINSIKNVLDMSLSGHAEPEDLKETLPIVKRVADTLAVLGIGDLRKNVTSQYAVLEKLSKQNSFDESALLDVAGKIIEIEHRLEAIAKVVGTNRDLASVNEREIEIDQAKVTVIKECQHGLEQAKDAIAEYISSKWDRSHLLNVGSLLHDIRGGLEMIPLQRPAAILGSCAQYIQEQLIDKEDHPVWASLETLADAIASVEYFLERLLGDMEGDIDSLLDMAEKSVDELGYPLQIAAPEPVVAADAPAAEAVSEQPPVITAEMPAESEQPEQPVEPELPEPVAEKIQPEPAPVPESVVPEPAPVEEEEDLEESDIDDEIIEIFIEEAEEVTETLQEYFPQWKNNQQDQDSLVVVRRAFHTLKGSGRMVEAFDIGELAWSVENMLNRVIDNTIPAVPSHAHIIELVLNLLPELIKAFANKKRNPHKAITEQYQTWANSMSDGNYPAELQAIPSGGPVPLPDFSAGPVVAVAATEPAPVENIDTSSEQDIEEDENLILMEIFSSEAISHLATMEEFIHKMERDAPIYSPPSDDFQRALHTLKGSAKMAQIIPIAGVTEPLEAFAKELISYQVEINADILQLYRDAVTYTRQALAQIEDKEPIRIDRLDQFVARTAELRELAVGHLIRLKELEKDGQKQVDPRLLSIFMAEEMNLLLDADVIVNKWQETGSDDGHSSAITKELETLQKGAEQAKLPDMAGLSEQLRTLYQQSQKGQQDLNEDFFAILGAGHESLLDMIDAVAAGQNVVPPSEEITSALASLIHNGSLRPAKGEFAKEQVEPAISSVEEPLEGVADEQEVTVEESAVDLATAEAVNEDDIFDQAVETAPAAEAIDPSQSDSAETKENTDLPTLSEGDIVLDQIPEPDISAADESDEIVSDQVASELVDTEQSPVDLQDSAESGRVDADQEDLPGNVLDDHDFGSISLDLIEETETVEESETGQESESLAEGSTDSDDGEIVLEEEPDDVHADYFSPDMDSPAFASIEDDEELPTQEEEEITLDLEPEDSLLADEDETLYFESPVEKSGDDADDSLPTLTVVAGDVQTDEIAIDTEASPDSELPLADVDQEEVPVVENAIESVDDIDPSLEPLPEFEAGETEEPLVLVDEIVDSGSVDLETEETDASELSPEAQLVAEHELSPETELSPENEEEIAPLDLAQDEEDGDIELVFETDTGSDELIFEERVSEELGSHELGSEEYVLPDVSLIENEDLPTEETSSEEPFAEAQDVPDQTSDTLNVDDIQIDSELPQLDVGEFDLYAEQGQAQSELDEDTGLEFSALETPELETVEFETIEFESGELDQTEPESAEPQVAVTATVPGLLDAIDMEQEDYDPDMINIFLEEANELVDSLEGAINNWENDWADTENPDEIKRALHTLKGGARLAGMSNLGELVHAYESYIISNEQDAIDNDFFSNVHGYQDQVHKGVQAIEAAVAGGVPVIAESDVAVADEPAEVTSTEPMANGAPQQETEELQGSPEVVAVPGLLDTIDVNAEDFDADIVDIFLEEAEELIEALDEAVHAWESDWANTENPEEIKRVLHTLKGGARLAGMANLGELTHTYESFLIGSKVEEVDDAFFAKIHGFQDQVLSGVRAVQAFMSSDASSAKPATAETAESSAAESAEPTATNQPTTFTTESNVLPFAPRPKEVENAGEFKMPAVKSGGSGGGAPAALRKQAGPQEVVKVNADLLEELVNLAGETSISRARIEQQVNDFGRALDDIDATIARLQEQLRRLDIETEAQVLFRQEQMAAHEEFDPLEMDRYSQLQQLSRSLIESASDLLDLRQTLTDNIRDTETLLLQQSRINTTLQEGLMRSRMVPFSRLVPRLRRIVRQVAGELGKNVSFELDNVEGELDRSMLERMVPPLEHMLRNAVDHGIELPEKRRDAGKSENGRIVLTLGREGGDVILRLADDGQGVNLRRVREKAIENGLMAPNAELSDFDIMQFVLHAGFSTAETVTQISGRGVGMDVVSSEIKAMGGSVLINSEWGKGTEVVIRLPFTVSVNRALMVEIGQDNYAIPLNTIEGIVRVSPFELEHYYSSEDARFEYAGENYQVRYLGTMLSDEVRPTLEGQALPLPVLLVRSADSTLAIQVDNLLGSREVVVKTLGSQFSAVQGLSGATLMGDGSVVVILDPHALVRKAMAARHVLEMQPVLEDSSQKAANDRVKTVMVVDDSVTVRKVTTRFLEREGFNVITAKDGVDALRTLQDEIPDIMLLDIEMPRMDGFEVATNIRTTSRWKHIPIIMITSRTGEKHRERAMSLGVDKYMGKPYQEETLLAGLNELLAKAEG